MAAASAAAATGWATIAKAALEAAIYYGLSKAIANQQGSYPLGGELNLNWQSDVSRSMLFGKQATAGSFVYWTVPLVNSRKNLHLAYCLADHRINALKKIYANGALVHRVDRNNANSPPQGLVHGQRTIIREYSSGGDRVWMTFWDGRPGQIADANLIAASLDDEQGMTWSTNHKGAGNAWIHIELLIDDNTLPGQVPEFLFEVEGALLYDRRKDSTAGGSGAHRLDNPSTWEYSTNCAVAMDHWLLGYRIENDPLAFGIGLPASYIPFSNFAALADLCDEMVSTRQGDMLARYSANGLITSALSHEQAIQIFLDQMNARITERDGGLTVIGADAQTPVISLDDSHLLVGEVVDFAEKKDFDDLVGGVRGSISDPENLWRPTNYEPVYADDWIGPGGIEKKIITRDLPLEIDPRLARRNAQVYIDRAQNLATLVGRFDSAAWELEDGDTFYFSSDKYQLDDEIFEVLTCTHHSDFSVSVIAQATTADLIAYNTDEDPDLLVAPNFLPATRVLDTPVFVLSAFALTGTNSIEPALRITPGALDANSAELLIEVREWSGSALVGDTIATSAHAEIESLVVRGGVKPASSYKARAKVRKGFSESEWSEWSAAVTVTEIEAVGQAESVHWSGVIDDGGKPADNATEGADWATNVTNKPTALYQIEADWDAALLAADAAIDAATALAAGAAAAAQSDVDDAFDALALAQSQLDGVEATVSTRASQTALTAVAADVAGKASVSYVDSAVAALEDADASLGVRATSLEQRVTTVETTGAKITDLEALAVQAYAIPAGSNALRDTEWRLGGDNINPYWDVDGTTGARAESIVTRVAGLRVYRVEIGSGASAGYNRLRSLPNANSIPVSPGDRVGARTLLGGYGAITQAYVSIEWRNDAGDFVGHAISDAPIPLTHSGSGGIDTFISLAAIGVAPAGATQACFAVRAYQDAGSAVFQIAEPLLTRMTADQTTVPLYSPGSLSESGADRTETSAAFLSEQSLRASADAALASDLNTLEAVVTDSSTGLSTRASQTSVTALEAAVDGKASVSYVDSAVAALEDADASLGVRATSLEQRVATVEATGATVTALDALEAAYQSADAALAGDIATRASQTELTQLEVAVDGKALASDLNTLEAAYQAADTAINSTHQEFVTATATNFAAVYDAVDAASATASAGDQTLQSQITDLVTITTDLEIGKASATSVEELRSEARAQYRNLIPVEYRAPYKDSATWYQWGGVSQHVGTGTMSPVWPSKSAMKMTVAAGDANNRYVEFGSELNNGNLHLPPGRYAYRFLYHTANIGFFKFILRSKPDQAWRWTADVSSIPNEAAGYFDLSDTTGLYQLGFYFASASQAEHGQLWIYRAQLVKIPDSSTDIPDWVEDVADGLLYQAGVQEIKTAQATIDGKLAEYYGVKLVGSDVSFELIGDGTPFGGKAVLRAADFEVEGDVIVDGTVTRAALASGEGSALVAEGLSANYYEQSADPGPVPNGSLWYKTTTSELYIRRSNAWGKVSDITPTGLVEPLGISFSEGIMSWIGSAGANKTTSSSTASGVGGSENGYTYKWFLMGSQSENGYSHVITLIGADSNTLTVKVDNISSGDLIFGNVACRVTDSAGNKSVDIVGFIFSETS